MSDNKTITLKVKDKEGVRLIELDPSKKYFLVVNKEVGASFFDGLGTKTMKEVADAFGTSYIFIVNDINGIRAEEKEHFLDILSRKEQESEKN